MSEGIRGNPDVGRVPEPVEGRGSRYDSEFTHDALELLRFNWSQLPPVRVERSRDTVRCVSTSAFWPQFIPSEVEGLDTNGLWGGSI